MVFIDARTEKLADLVPQVFTRSTMHKFDKVMGYNWDNQIPYFAIDNLGPYKGGFVYICPQFCRCEDLLTGDLSEFRINPFPDPTPIEIEQLREEFKVLAEILKGQSEAS